MASSPLLQVPDTAVDLPGLSISTAVRSPTDPRDGAIYDNLNLAAAAPVHFHPMAAPAMGGGTFMMLNARRWTAATSSATDPGYASAFTEDLAPSWALVNAATGGAVAMNSGYSMPIKTAGVTSPVLTAALSRGTPMLYTLLSTNLGAVVQHWNNNTAINTLNPVNEEIIPTGSCGSDTVVSFSAGMDYSSSTDPYMVFYGVGGVTSHVYMARKRWSRVGDVGISTRAHDGQWEFYDGQGWGLDPTALAPVQTATGPMTSAGPMSFAHYGTNRAIPGKITGYTLASVVVASGSTRTAQIYESLGGRPWLPLGDPIALGVVGSTYVGGTAQLQGQLGANPAMVDTAASASAVPYLVTTKLTSGSTHQLHVEWGLIQVARQT
jgi:hypothetical protein